MLFSPSGDVSLEQVEIPVRRRRWATGNVRQTICLRFCIVSEEIPREEAPHAIFEVKSKTLMNIFQSHLGFTPDKHHQEATYSIYICSGYVRLFDSFQLVVSLIKWSDYRGDSGYQ